MGIMAMRSSYHQEIVSMCVCGVLHACTHNLALSYTPLLTAHPVEIQGTDRSSWNIKK